MYNHWRVKYLANQLFGDSNIWQLGLKMQLMRLTILITAWKETDAYSLNGVHLI